jgi:shikimate dehydrogenase
MFKLGLIGKNISYSFSRDYFNKKFETEKIKNVSYENFDIESIDSFPLLVQNTENIKGFNVTIPYKETIIPYLDALDETANKIGAVNTIKITNEKKLIGYNTDFYGFKKSLKPLLKPHHKKALILGTGGASKAIAFSLKALNIEFSYVSRVIKPNIDFDYFSLTEDIIQEHEIIINCTPVGTFPEVDKFPKIPYSGITKNHILYDLIYNPKETSFLKQGILHNASIINGLKMLELQAEEAWSIWNLK